MTPITIDTVEQMEKLFDLDEWRERMGAKIIEDLNAMRVLSSLNALDLSDSARDFLYEYDLYYPRQFKFEWECTEILEEKETRFEVEGKFYLPDEYAVLFKLAIL
ncbi:hypothetical protein D3C72_194500 [compost metagenome]